jgi:hypothetical protein
MIGLAANTRIIVNGQEVQGLEALPPEARAKFDNAMQKLGQLGIIPSGMQGTSFQSAPQISTREPVFAKSPSIIQSAPSAISEDSGSRTGMILLAIFGILVLCALAAAAGFLLFAR